MPLYARFGDNFAPVVGALSSSFGKHLITFRSLKNPTCSRAVCRRLQATGLGTVTVALSRSPNPGSPVLGTSLCQFEYVTDFSGL
jgi:hypothetical protein